MVYANASHAVAAHAQAAPHHRLDGTRITAGAGAIAANAVILLLMLAPVAMPELRPQMIERAGGRTTVPQIFIGAQHIGGCDDMLALDARGQLDPLLNL